MKSQQEIEATQKQGELRGLRFGVETLPYCGTQARVLARVDRIIDEKTGRMLRLRDCYTYWREAWLRRVDPAAIGLVGEGPR